MKIHLNYFTGSLFALALFAFTVKVGAANYYIDATSGNDSYNGISPTTAWKTLSKLNSITLYAGDVVALKRGEVWRETLPVNNSGTAGNYIRYTSYGTGAKPKIIGSVSELTGWTLYSGNIWQKSLTTDPAQITFTKDGVDNFGYEQTGIANCNADYKYYWASNVLYVYATSDPNGYYSAIERHSLASGAIFSADYIWLDGLEIAYFTNRGIRTNQADYAKITYCKIHHIASGGFDSNGEGIYNLSSYVLISHNEIYECGSHGIYNGSYQPYKSNFDTVEYNRVYNCYHTGIDNMNVDWTTYVGGNVIRYNVVFDSSAQGGNAVSPDYGSSGIQVMGHYQAGTAAHWFSNAKIYGNIVYGNAVVGLNIVEFSDSVYIYNNTLYDNNSQGILIRDRNPKAGDGQQDHPKYLWMYNNISSSSGYQDIQVDSLTNKSIDYNVYYSDRFTYFGQAKGTNYSSLSSWQTATGFDANSYLNDPLFINTNTYDFTLQSSSPAIDAGTNLVNSSPYFWTEDIEGTSTPQNGITDIGVYEKIQGGGGNNPPGQPANPSPANGAVNQNINTTISWSCSDPDGDPLTYDVYFGETNNPPLISGNQTSTSYDPVLLDYNTTYYWKIVAKDNQGASTAGPVWSFSTEMGGSNGGDTTLVTANIRVFLDGPYTDDAMSTDLSANSLVPTAQPYNQQPWNYAGSENVSNVSQNIVDWILVELRTGTGASTVVARRAAFLRNDGMVVDLNGQAKVLFPGIQDGQYYIVIRHRNHLAIMSKNPLLLTDTSSLYDFTLSEDKAYGNQPMKYLGNDKFGLYAADGNANGNVNNSDYAGVWKKENGSLGYEPGDFDLNGGVNIVDRNAKWNPNKGKSSQVP